MRSRSCVVTCLVLVFWAVLSGQIVAGAERVPAKQLDLKYVTADFYGAILLHPQRIAKVPVIAELLNEKNVAEILKMLPFDPLKIEQVQMFAPLPADQRTGPVVVGPCVALRLSPPVNADSVAKAVLGRPGVDRKVAAVTLLGRKCYKFEGLAEEPPKGERRPWIPPSMTCVADDRTVLHCPRGEADLQKMLSGRDVRSPLVEQLRRTNIDYDAIGVIAIGAVREVFKAEREGERKYAPPPAVVMLDIVPLLEHLTVTLNLKDDALTALLQAADAQTAAKVEALVKDFRQKAKDEIEKERKDIARMPPRFRESAERTMAAAEKFINTMTVTKKDAAVVIAVKPIGGIVRDTLKTWFEVIPAEEPQAPPVELEADELPIP